jgi:hypothetical protein
MASSNVQRINDLGRIVKPSDAASIITSDEAAADAVRIQAIDTAGGVTIASGTGGVPVSSTGSISATSSQAAATAVNLLASAGGIKLKTALGLYTPITTATQLLSKTSSVTCNADAGIITTVALTDAADASFTFTVGNNRVIGTDSMVLLTPIRTGLGTTGVAHVEVTNIQAASFDVTVTNVGTAVFNSQLKIQFLVLNHSA